MFIYWNDITQKNNFEGFRYTLKGLYIYINAKEAA